MPKPTGSRLALPSVSATPGSTADSPQDVSGHGHVEYPGKDNSSSVPSPATATRIVQHLQRLQLLPRRSDNTESSILLSLRCPMITVSPCPSSTSGQSITSSLRYPLVRVPRPSGTLWSDYHLVHPVPSGQSVSSSLRYPLVRVSVRPSGTLWSEYHVVPRYLLVRVSVRPSGTNWSEYHLVPPVPSGQSISSSLRYPLVRVSPRPSGALWSECHLEIHGTWNVLRSNNSLHQA
jgi:hypothetical protein